MPDAYVVARFADQHAVGPDDVVALWTREAGLGEAEARRRLGEVLLVATAADGTLVAVATAFLRRNDQLRMDLWHFRTFVAAGHRGGDVARKLASATRDVLRDRFVSGQDVRGAGMIVEVEHDGLKRHLNTAVWPRTQLVFVGENARGDHVRVHFFPGALAPEPHA